MYPLGAAQASPAHTDRGPQPSSPCTPGYLFSAWAPDPPYVQINVPSAPPTLTLLSLRTTAGASWLCWRGGSPPDRTCPRGLPTTHAVSDTRVPNTGQWEKEVSTGPAHPPSCLRPHASHSRPGDRGSHTGARRARDKEGARPESLKAWQQKPSGAGSSHTPGKKGPGHHQEGRQALMPPGGRVSGKRLPSGLRWAAWGEEAGTGATGKTQRTGKEGPVAKGPPCHAFF